MFRATVVIFCLIQSSECQLTNLTTSTIGDVVRVSASFISRFLDAKSTALLPSALGKYLEKTKDSRSEGFVTLLLRAFRLDPERIQEWALRGFISLLPLMNEVLTEKEGQTRRRRSAEEFSFFRFILQRPLASDLLAYMQDPHLIDRLLKESEERLAGADCVKLLICKTTPVVRGMQKSLRFFLRREKMETCDAVCSEVENAWERANLIDRMYFFLPSFEDVVKFGDECDERYPGCGY